jgi:hypothetical protein
MAKRYYPEKFNTVTNADQSAMILDIERIPGESLFEYKKRVLESSSKIANSSYLGLINGINRELGLTQLEVIRATFKNILIGDLDNPLIDYNEYIITDNRAYSETIDGTNTKVVANKLISSTLTWAENELVGFTLTIDTDTYQVLSNTTTQLTLDRTLESLYVAEVYALAPERVVNSFIGYTLILEKEQYIVVSNTEDTLTLNKPISYRENGYFFLGLSRPRVEITASRIIFYIEYLNDANYRVDSIIDLRENNLTHRDLCTKVNAESKYYALEDLIPLDDPVKAFTLKHKDSDIQVFQEEIPASKFFKLKNQQIKQDTIKFSESNIFSKEEEILPEDLNGPYYSVNYPEGIIKTTMLPDGTGEVSYTYIDFPFTIQSVPVVVLSLSDRESEKFLFSQREKVLYEDSRDRFVSSQPKTEMIEYVSELLSINRQSWGI